MRDSTKTIISTGLLILGIWLFAIMIVYTPHHEEQQISGVGTYTVYVWWIYPAIVTLIILIAIVIGLVWSIEK